MPATQAAAMGGGMRLVATIVETLWGVSLPVEQLGPLMAHCAQACVAALLRVAR